jgi:hypothetical protein
MRRSPFSAIAVALVATALVSTAVAAKGPPGGEPTEEAANNLSVPAIFVPSTTGAPTLGFACGAAVAPSDVLENATTYFAAPLSPAPAGDYYIQGEDRWQASCGVDADGLAVNAEWGDNLVSAPLKQGTPIRVEIGFLVADLTVDPIASMTGFPVYKLTDELDRLATYGTLGVAQSPLSEVRVWDGGTHLAIVGPVSVYDGAFTAEVNSTGRIVFGYNWSRPVAGTYTITVIAPTVTISSADAGTLVNEHTVSITVEVAVKSGGGGGGGGGGPH